MSNDKDAIEILLSNGLQGMLEDAEREMTGKVVNPLTPTDADMKDITTLSDGFTMHYTAEKYKLPNKPYAVTVGRYGATAFVGRGGHVASFHAVQLKEETEGATLGVAVTVNGETITIPVTTFDVMLTRLAQAMRGWQDPDSAKWTF